MPVARHGLPLIVVFKRTMPVGRLTRNSMPAGSNIDRDESIVASLFFAAYIAFLRRGAGAAMIIRRARLVARRTV
jgi:hypothetical protein